MNLKDSLKKYFEEEIKKDSALAEKYDGQKIAECESYVINEAKKYLHSQSGAVEDVIVFKWARDFFIDGVKTEGISEKAKTVIEEEKKSGIPETVESEKKEKNQVSKSKKKNDDLQLSFDF